MTLYQPLLQNIGELQRQVSSLYELEEDPAKKIVLKGISTRLVQLAEQIAQFVDNRHVSFSDKKEAASSWKEIRHLLFRYGARELIEQITNLL